MNISTVGFIGGGRITGIILQAFANKSVGFGSVSVYDPDKGAITRLKKRHQEISIAETYGNPAACDIVFIAVHPPAIPEVLNSLRDKVKEDSVIVSLAPKITIEKILSLVPSAKVIRMIPNATSVINKGYNPVCFSEGFSKPEKKALMKLFRVLGKTMIVDEQELEAYAIISAMLPTYFWFQWRKMHEIAMGMGFSEKRSRKIVRSTLKRSISLFYHPSFSHDEVIDMIPVKPIGEHEKEIESVFEAKLGSLYNKLKP